MDPTTVADTFGTYRPTQQTTPTQRRVLRWWNRTVLAAATIWLLVLVLRNDLGAALPILVWIVVAAAVSTTCLAPTLTEALNPLEDESHGGTEEVPR
ncbi:hypothetical protein [Quadrisphaera setariae]|uniref:Uncharacterized protein n=1 Tax=Quadrisphaera setariae TaxID=2593304 RepID=A0A5C8ZLA9_9ACTN|nr:hypothetical protein [Quadrisphaera setariae]TXR57580.1 hypothetical protein FMM08_05010 [Quadrisphaera setariae]